MVSELKEKVDILYIVRKKVDIVRKKVDIVRKWLI